MDKKGFTIIELLVVTVTLIILTAVMSKGLSKLYKWYEKQQTEKRLNAIEQGLEAYYKSQAFLVDSNARDQLFIQWPGSNVRVTINNNTNIDSTPMANLLARGYIALAPAEIEKDGFKNPFRIFISNRLNNGLVQYKVIAIVSPGPNGILETSFNSNDGTLVVGGDDMAVVVDGETIEYNKYQDTLERMKKYVHYLSDFFFLAYSSDPSKNIAIDHFINARRNQSPPSDDQQAENELVDINGFPNSCNISSNCLATAQQLGISIGSGSIADQTSAWYISGNQNQTYIYIDNDGNNVRSPDNPNSNMSAPPYTARVVTNTPWGSQIILTAVGNVGG